jgi:hypothetical protein
VRRVYAQLAAAASAPAEELEWIALLAAHALRPDAVDAELPKKLAAFASAMGADDDQWLFADYVAAFESIPELAALTNTPFMVEIVMKILKQLKKLSGTEASMKQTLTLLLEEDASQIVWAKLAAYQRDDKLALDATQRALEGDKSRASLAALDDLRELASESASVMRKKTPPVSLPEALLQTADDDDDDDDDAHVARVIDTVLRRVLRRPPVRRDKIYLLFVQHYLEHAARKTAGRFATEELLREGTTYATHLALKMVEENVSKIVVRESSKLFATKGVFDDFVGTDTELLIAARQAAPVKFQVRAPPPRPFSTSRSSPLLPPRARRRRALSR